MTDDSIPADITELAHQRGSDGQLLPVEKTIQVRGEGEATVKVYPATTGQRNEWRQKLEAEGDEVPTELEGELLAEFLPYEPGDFGASEWSELRPALVDALSNAIFAELFDTGDDDFQQAVNERLESVTGNPTPTSTG